MSASNDFMSLANEMRCSSYSMQISRITTVWLTYVTLLLKINPPTFKVMSLESTTAEQKWVYDVLVLIVSVLGGTLSKSAYLGSFRGICPMYLPLRFLNVVPVHAIISRIIALGK